MIREIGVGDLLRAWDTLGAEDEATRAAIRDMLLPQFIWQAPEAEPARAAVREPAAAPPATLSPPTPSEPARATAEARKREAEVAFAVTVEHHEREVPLLWPESGPRLEDDRDLSLEPEMLLEPVWVRRVVGNLMSTEAQLGDIDLGKLVRAVVEMRPLRRMPRTRRTTLRLGAQVLFDRDPSLMVFYSDQSALRPVLEGIGGRERTAIQRCDGFPPTRVSELNSARWRPYSPPLPGTPILLVGDLGMARGAFPLSEADEARWDAFFGGLRARRNPVCALVPCAPELYPPFVRELVDLVLWDRRTRPSDVRRVRGGGR